MNICINELLFDCKRALCIVYFLFCVIFTTLIYVFVSRHSESHFASTGLVIWRRVVVEDATLYVNGRQFHAPLCEVPISSISTAICLNTLVNRQQDWPYLDRWDMRTNALYYAYSQGPSDIVRGALSISMGGSSSGTFGGCVYRRRAYKDSVNHTTSFGNHIEGRTEDCFIIRPFSSRDALPYVDYDLFVSCSNTIIFAVCLTNELSLHSLDITAANNYIYHYIPGNPRGVWRELHSYRACLKPSISLFQQGCTSYILAGDSKLYLCDSNNIRHVADVEADTPRGDTWPNRNHYIIDRDNGEILFMVPIKWCGKYSNEKIRTLRPYDARDALYMSALQGGIALLKDQEKRCLMEATGDTCSVITNSIVPYVEVFHRTETQLGKNAMRALVVALVATQSIILYLLWAYTGLLLECAGRAWRAIVNFSYDYRRGIVRICRCSARLIIVLAVIVVLYAASYGPVEAYKMIRPSIAIPLYRPLVVMLRKMGISDFRLYVYIVWWEHLRSDKPPNHPKHSSSTNDVNK